MFQFQPNLSWRSKWIFWNSKGWEDALKAIQLCLDLITASLHSSELDPYLSFFTFSPPLLGFKLNQTVTKTSNC